MKKQLQTCSANEYVGLAGDVARRVADLPAQGSAAIREWVATLYSRVKAGQETIDVLAPFVQGLAAREDEHAADLLGRIMVDGSMAMSEDVAEWLGDMGPKARAAVPHLKHLLTSDSETWPRAKAAYALGAIGERGARTALLTAIRDPDGTVRNAALDALIMLKESISFEDLFDLARQDPDYLVRAAAIRALRRAHRERSASALEALAREETNPTVLKAISDPNAAQ